MRNLLAVAVVVGLLAVPSFGEGTMTLTLLANGAPNVTVAPGTDVTISLFVKGDTQAVSSVAGSITANPAAGANGASGFTPVANLWAGASADPWNLLPTYGPNGAVLNFALQQNTALADSNTPAYGLGQDVLMATWTVKALAPIATYGFERDDSFALSNLYNCLVGNDTMDLVVNSATVATPEPVSLALLALGGLVVARRRR